jgi:hypothetical protein
MDSESQMRLLIRLFRLISFPPAVAHIVGTAIKSALSRDSRVRDIFSYSDQQLRLLEQPPKRSRRNTNGK